MSGESVTDYPTQIVVSVNPPKRFVEAWNICRDAGPIDGCLLTRALPWTIRQVRSAERARGDS
jgi:hypothetical protein